MAKFNTIIKLTLMLTTIVLSCIVQGVPMKRNDIPVGQELDPKVRHKEAAPFYFIPTPNNETLGAPVARVFGDRLYVYMTRDDQGSCGEKDTSPLKMEGYFYGQPGFGKSGFCNPSITIYSTNDPTLLTGWVKHAMGFHERFIPWVYKPPGFAYPARLGAPDIVQGNDGLYYLFFSAVKDENTYAIGAAVSETPIGPFQARALPIKGTDHLRVKEPFTGTTPGMDPSLIKLTNGKWVMFSVNSTQHYYLRCDPSNTGMNWQYINSDFTAVEKASPVRHLIPTRRPYVRAPFVEYRSGNLYMHYAEKSGLDGFTIRQVVANSPKDPSEGFKEVGVTINNIDPLNRSNKVSLVTFKGKSYAFYHYHVDNFRDKVKKRRSGFSPIKYKCDGSQERIIPYEDSDKVSITMQQKVHIGKDVTK